MALAAASVWEVRTTGNDSNGGGFVAGQSGTDWSQFDSPQYALTGIASAGSGNTILSASAAADMVGNIAQVISGTNFNTGFFQILSVSVGVSITFSTNAASQSICTGVGASGVINIGGALLTVSKAQSGAIRSNKIWIKAGTYSLAGNVTFSVGGNFDGTDPATRIIGYNTSRGDINPYLSATRPVLQIASSTGISALTLSGASVFAENLDIDCNSLATTTALTLSGSNCFAINCKMRNYGTAGIAASNSQGGLFKNEITGGLSGATAGINATNNVCAMGNYIHDTAGGHGIATGAGATGASLVRNVIANIAGASADGINTNSSGFALGNTIYKAGRHGIFDANNAVNSMILLNNILHSNGGFGTKINLAAAAAMSHYDGNMYYNNTSGTRNNMDDVGGTNPQNASGPYTNTRDLILSADPFVNAAGGDYRLTPAARALMYAAGIPDTWPGLATMKSFLDMGAIQHQDVGFAG